MTEFTQEQIDRAVRLLNRHYAHCEMHYEETLDEIGEHDVLSTEAVQELINHPEVESKVHFR